MAHEVLQNLKAFQAISSTYTNAPEKQHDYHNETNWRFHGQISIKNCPIKIIIKSSRPGHHYADHPFKSIFCMKTFVIWLNFHWCLLQLTMNHHWFTWWLGAIRQQASAWINVDHLPTISLAYKRGYHTIYSYHDFYLLFNIHHTNLYHIFSDGAIHNDPWCWLNLQHTVPLFPW